MSIKITHRVELEDSREIRNEYEINHLDKFKDNIYMSNLTHSDLIELRDKLIELLK